MIESTFFGRRHGGSAYSERRVADSPFSWQITTRTGLLGDGPTFPEKVAALARHPQGLDVVGECAKEHFGLTAAAVGTTAAGQPIIKKPRVGVGGGGSHKKTSIASTGLRKLFPQKLRGFGFLSTKGVGAILGRIVPYAGWGLVAYDVYSIVNCAYRKLY